MCEREALSKEVEGERGEGGRERETTRERGSQRETQRERAAKRKRETEGVRVRDRGNECTTLVGKSEREKESKKARGSNEREGGGSE